MRANGPGFVYTQRCGIAPRAGLVELADTLALGASGLTAVQVRVLYPAPKAYGYNEIAEFTGWLTKGWLVNEH